MLPVLILLLICIQSFYTGNEAREVSQRISEKSAERIKLTFWGAHFNIFWGDNDNKIPASPAIENRMGASEFNVDEFINATDNMMDVEDLTKIKKLLATAGPTCQIAIARQPNKCDRDTEKILWRCAKLNMQISNLSEIEEERNKTHELASQQVLDVFNLICADPSMDDICLKNLGSQLTFKDLNAVLNEHIRDTLIDNCVIQEEHFIYHTRGKIYLNMTYYNPLAYKKACESFKKANELKPNQRHNMIYLQLCTLIGPSTNDLRRFTDMVNLISTSSSYGVPYNEYVDTELKKSIENLFVSIDNLMKTDSSENLAMAYDQMNSFYAEDGVFHHDFQLCSRYAKILLKYARKFYKKGTSDYILICQKALDYSNRALRHNPNDPNVNLWAAASLEAVLEFDPKIESWIQGFKIKEYLDKAKPLTEKNDPDFYHLYGKWHFEASKRYFSTLNVACNNIKKAHDIKSDWSENEAYFEDCRKVGMF